MTTAHRPTFDPARGKEAQRGPAYHQRLLPAHSVLKTRQQGQGTVTETNRRDLRAQLLEAEAAHFAKTRGTTAAVTESDTTPKRRLEGGPKDTDNDEDEDFESKRRRILEETRDIDADSEGSGSEEDEDEEESDDEDEADNLMRELARIKQEKAEQREREEAEREAQEQEARDRDIATGNPLLNPTRDFNVKRRWDDDVVFKNQARGTEDKRKKEFVNDLLRSDFHKRFMGKYVRDGLEFAAQADSFTSSAA